MKGGTAGFDAADSSACSVAKSTGELYQLHLERNKLKLIVGQLFLLLVQIKLPLPYFFLCTGRSSCFGLIAR